MSEAVPFPGPGKLRVAVIPEVVLDHARGLTFVSDVSTLDEIRRMGHIPLVVPVHGVDGRIDVAAHAFIRWGFDFIHASETLKNELDERANLWAVKEYAERLIGERQELAMAVGSDVEHPSDIGIGEHLPPRVAVVPDLKDGRITISQRFIDALRLGSRVLPVIMSDTGSLDEDMEIAGVSGILLPGSNSHYHPKHYGASQDGPDSAYDLARDALVKAAIEKAYAEDLPLFGICSGLQGIILFGAEKGRLIPDLHRAERPGHHADRQPAKADFREAVSILATTFSTMPKKKPLHFVAAHTIQLQPGAFLTHLLNQALRFRNGNQTNIGRGFDVPVNSLHHQAIDETSLGDDLSIEGLAEDGTIEAIHSRHHRYIVGVQFHPEAAFMKDVPPLHPLEAALYRALFSSFGQATSDWNWKQQVTRKGGGGNWRNRGMAWIYMNVPGTIHMTPEFVTGGGFSGTACSLMPKLWWN